LQNKKNGLSMILVYVIYVTIRRGIIAIFEFLGRHT